MLGRSKFRRNENKLGESNESFSFPEIISKQGEAYCFMVLICHTTKLNSFCVGD